MTVLSRKSGGSGGGGAPSGPAGGDLGGTYPNPTLAADSVDAVAIDGADAAAIAVALNLGVWATYVPALTASVGNPTLGAASSQAGRWCSVGKLGIVEFRITFGTSGTAAGSGVYRVGLPFTVGASQVSYGGGSGLLYDSSAGDAFAVALGPVGGQAYMTMFTSQSVTASDVTEASPVPWNTSDVILGCAMVEIA